MNDLQAAEIVDVLRSHWPTWKFEGEELNVWVEKLRRYDYGRAKAAINNFYMAQTRQGKPAPGNILATLRQNAVDEQGMDQNIGPVLLYEIIKDSQPKGQKFFANIPRNVPPKEDIEKMSDVMRQNFDDLYGGEHVVVRHWATDDIPF
jgi:hypothetical protein